MRRSRGPVAYVKDNERVGNNVGLDWLRRVRLPNRENSTTPRMVNKNGKVVAPNCGSFQAAANPDWSSKPGYGVIFANQVGPPLGR
jgi:phosphate transport system substrate-binding protein